MIKQRFKKILLALAAVILFAPQFVWALGAPVQINLLDKNTVVDIEDQSNRSGSAFGQGTTGSTLTQFVANLINVFLGLLGTIFIILIIYGGYTWMTAAGNAEKVTKAQTTLRVAIIGLIIIAASYAITYFIFARLPDAGQDGSTIGTGQTGS
jgi:hypothetical protein